MRPAFAILALGASAVGMAAPTDAKSPGEFVGDALYAVRLSDGRPHRVPRASGLFYSLAVSGNRIAYMTDGSSISYFDTATLSRRPFLPVRPLAVDGGAEWSPSGTRRVFAAPGRSGVNDDIYMFSVSWGTTTRIARNGLGPRWSPTADRIAYTIPGESPSLLHPHGTAYRVVVIDSRGRRLWSHPGFLPSWSPGGGSLALVQPVEMTSIAGDGRSRIVVFSARGRRRWRMPGCRTQWISETTLAVTVKDGGGCFGRQYVADLARFSVSWLPSAEKVSVWSPDGRNRAWQTTTPDDGRVHVSVGTRSLVLAPRGVHGYVWGPDSWMIALWRRNDIWVANADGSGLRQIVRVHAPVQPADLRWLTTSTLIFATVPP